MEGHENHRKGHDTSFESIHIDILRQTFGLGDFKDHCYVYWWWYSNQNFKNVGFRQACPKFSKVTVTRDGTESCPIFSTCQSGRVRPSRPQSRSGRSRCSPILSPKMYARSRSSSPSHSRRSWSWARESVRCNCTSDLATVQKLIRAIAVKWRSSHLRIGSWSGAARHVWGHRGGERDEFYRGKAVYHRDDV